MKYFVVKIYDVVTNTLASFHIQLKFWTQFFVTKSSLETKLYSCPKKLCQKVEFLVVEDVS